MKVFFLGKKEQEMIEKKKKINISLTFFDFFDETFADIEELSINEDIEITTNEEVSEKDIDKIRSIPHEEMRLENILNTYLIKFNLFRRFSFYIDKKDEEFWKEVKIKVKNFNEDQKKEIKFFIKSFFIRDPEKKVLFAPSSSLRKQLRNRILLQVFTGLINEKKITSQETALRLFHTFFQLDSYVSRERIEKDLSERILRIQNCQYSTPVIISSEITYLLQKGKIELNEDCIQENATFKILSLSERKAFFTIFKMLQKKSEFYDKESNLIAYGNLVPKEDIFYEKSSYHPILGTSLYEFSKEYYLNQDHISKKDMVFIENLVKNLSKVAFSFEDKGVETNFLLCPTVFIDPLIETEVLNHLRKSFNISFPLKGKYLIFVIHPIVNREITKQYFSFPEDFWHRLQSSNFSHISSGTCNLYEYLFKEGVQNRFRVLRRKETLYRLTDLTRQIKRRGIMWTNNELEKKLCQIKNSQLIEHYTFNASTEIIEIQLNKNFCVRESKK